MHNNGTNEPDEAEVLDAETLAALDQGIKTAENGRRWTLVQATEFALKRREAWKKIPEDLIA